MDLKFIARLKQISDGRQFWSFELRGFAILQHEIRLEIIFFTTLHSIFDDFLM